MEFNFENCKCFEFSAGDENIQEEVKEEKDIFESNLDKYYEEKVSKKQKRREENFLKKHKYDPDTKTIETDIPDKNGNKVRANLNITNGPLFSDRQENLQMIHDNKLPSKGKGLERRHINISRKTLQQKPSLSSMIFKHEEGHMFQEMYPEDFKKVKEEIQKLIDDIQKPLSDHAKEVKEYIADLYAMKNSGYGSKGMDKLLNALKSFNDSYKNIDYCIRLMNTYMIGMPENIEEAIKIYNEYKSLQKAYDICDIKIRECNAIIKEYEDEVQRDISEEKFQKIYNYTKILYDRIYRFNNTKELLVTRIREMRDPISKLKKDALKFVKTNPESKIELIKQRMQKNNEVQLRKDIAKDFNLESFSLFDEDSVEIITHGDFRAIFDNMESKVEMLNNHMQSMSESRSNELSDKLPKGIAIRPAKESDSDKMFEYEMDSIDTSLKKDPEVIKLIKDDVKDSINNTKIIITTKYNKLNNKEEEDKVIGMLTTSIIDEFWLYIGEIFLEKEYRNKGIGSIIIKDLIEHHDKLILQVAFSNTKAIKFYKSLGFSIVETNEKNKMYVMKLDRYNSIEESISLWHIIEESNINILE